MSLGADGEACFLNVQRRVTFPTGWNEPVVDKLWLYNLHYFEGLLAPDDGAQALTRRAWVQRWIHDNPPGQGNGWEPYPLSLRITNWIKWMLGGEPPTPEVLHSLAVQTRYLSKRLEYHLMGNHLFENAKALIVAGCFFAGDEADHWYSTGRRIMEAQLQEQLLEDGGHFERSPMYQALLLEGLLDLHNLHMTAGVAGSSPWASPAAKMLEWLRRLCHPDGEIAFFNDAAFGVAPSLDELHAYAMRLGLDKASPEAAEPSWLGASGYARLEVGGTVVLADVAPVGPDYLPGHAHADSLSFECSIQGQRVLVNGGTSTYTLGAERQRQRGTASHNTVCIDGEDSSEVWAGFRVARRAYTQVVNFTAGPEVTLDAFHDGYARLPGKPVHRRRWVLRPGMLEVIDQVQSQGSHRIDVHFHVHPDVTLRAVQDSVFEIRDLGDRVIGTMEVDDSLTWELRNETWHPGFGVAVPSMGLHGVVSLLKSHEWRTRVRWSS
ncbi:heparinase II/III family protein [Hydrogenophaga sp. XSHU_21]